ncbi:hypothetical protein AX15_002371 [Amanita polypyramis BW_CC]|nr:hypothetical protein AX15_002371 [Amanita polypyramis BW_CC]
MATSPAKRQASASPDAYRPPKRLATSSPEEGELDDPVPLSPQSQPLHSSLQPNPQPLAKPKVPFPFKKKTEQAKIGSASGGESNESDGRFARDADVRRRQGRAPGRSSMIADHWEPGYGSSSSRFYPPQRWDSYPPRDYRDRERDRDRERGRSPPPPVPSSYSPQSRSPSSRSHSGQREKHRLPAHHVLPRDASFSPPPRVRDRERERDRDIRDRDERERDRDRRYREEQDDRHYYPEDLDRYDRRDRELYPYRRGDDRRGGGCRETSYEHDYDRSYRYDDRDRGRRMDSYRPSSPPRYAPVSPHPPPPLVSPPPQSQPPPLSQPPSPPPPPPPPPPSSVPQPRSPPSQPPSQTAENGQITGTPPPPPQSPPPPPPPDTRLLPKNDMLPDLHVHVTIPMKRPGAPRDIHSPPSILHHAPPVDGEDKEKKDKQKVEPKARLVRAREISRRSRKEEVEAFGRMFVGCGEQSDYEVTTKLGEGTFGEVHKAIQKSTRKVVALKRILMHNEKEGMPVTALREIKILKALKHSCIVDILDMFVVRSTQKDPLSVYMVFPYMDHDLAGLLENERVKLQPSHIKLYMKQLLEGTEYMHRNHILHRDMKAANLLISNNGSLKIADFGLARSYDPNVSRSGLDSRGRERRYTNCVVTLWYRPPELLLGARHYGGEMDIWGIGCVLGEMFSRRPILPGTSDLDQLEKIWQLCGTPNQHSWPNYDALPGCEGVKRFQPQCPRRIKQAYESVGPETCDLLDKLLTCNPRERITAAQALDHEYFWTDPLPADPKT